LKTKKQDLTNREDIQILIDKFYKKIRYEDTLGPIFNRTIKNWPAHLDHITNFWESNLFLTKGYQGNPVAAHQKLDQQENNSIEMNHFGI
jgi:hemoglobin